MDFAAACRAFSQSLDGTDSYVELKDNMQQLAECDADNACAYYLIYGFARSYILLYEDQAISPEFARRVKETMMAYLTTLGLNGLPEDKTLRWEAVNRVVCDYMQGDKIF